MSAGVGLARLLGVIVLACTLLPAHAQMIAKLQTVDGMVAITKVSGRPSLAAVGTELAAGDVVATMKNSTALLVFTDQTQIAMRPESQLVIPEYSHIMAEPDSDSMVVKLLKGGLRTVSGKIGSRGNRNAYQVAAAGTTLGVRGSDFIVRLCTDDCAPSAPARDARYVAPSAAGTVAKVSAMQGSVTATLNGASRPLSTSKALFAGDVLASADQSYASLAFVDGTQFTLKANTKATIVAFNYDRERLDQNRVTLNVSSGGGQFTTGAVGKLNPQGVRIESPSAYIGVRGTRFDFACAATGAHGEQGAQLTTCGAAFYVHVDEGRVTVGAGNEEREFAAGQTAYVPRPGQPAVQLSVAPRFVTEGPQPGAVPSAGAAPAADSGKAPDAEPSQQPGAGPLQGLLVSANEGTVVIARAGEELVLTRGEAGHLTGSAAPVTRLAATPAFIDSDPFLTRVQFLDASCFD